VSDALDQFGAFIDALPTERASPKDAQTTTEQHAEPPSAAARQKLPSTVAPVLTEVRRPPRPPAAALNMHRDANWEIDERAVRERLCRWLDATSQPRQRPAGAARPKAGPEVQPHAMERDAERPRLPEVEAHGIVVSRDGDAPTHRFPPPEHLVQRLATALATPRPWQRRVDPERALRYFEGRAKQMLAAARDPATLVAREERLAIEHGEGAADPHAAGPQKGHASQLRQAPAAAGNGPAPQPYPDDLLADVLVGISPPKTEQSAEFQGEASPDEWNDRREPAELPPLPKLEGEQADALAAIETFLGGEKQSFCMHGLAGTGKTTVMAALASRLANAILVAPTGKAASVLAHKTGLDVMTLHRLLYTPEVDEEGNVVGWAEKHQPGQLADQVVLVDEASMVGVNLARDLLRTGAKVVASGDPGQLPPVNQEQFFTAADVTLREIRRQAAGSSIIRQAHAARAGRRYASEDKNFQIIDRHEMMRRLDWADVVLCWRNATRHRLNTLIRWHRRRLPAEAHPNPGEPVMCLENHASGMMNGEIFTVRDFDPVRGILLEDGPGWIPAPWFEWLSPGGKQPLRRAAFALGYTITTHKSQGSEWPHVMVMDEYTGADRARWRYTAITRASASVCIVPPSEIP
jgi:exodeoxyribonuclease-5